MDKSIFVARSGRDGLFFFKNTCWRGREGREGVKFLTGERREKREKEEEKGREVGGWRLEVYFIFYYRCS